SHLLAAEGAAPQPQGLTDSWRAPSARGYARRMTDQLRDESGDIRRANVDHPASIRQADEMDVDQVDDAEQSLGAISTTPVDDGASPTADADDQWADQMADGEDFDESLGERESDERVLATDELDEIDDDDAPEGS